MPDHEPAPRVGGSVTHGTRRGRVLARQLAVSQRALSRAALRKTKTTGLCLHNTEAVSPVTQKFLLRFYLRQGPTFRVHSKRSSADATRRKCCDVIPQRQHALVNCHPSALASPSFFSARCPRSASGRARGDCPRARAASSRKGCKCAPSHVARALSVSAAARGLVAKGGGERVERVSVSSGTATVTTSSLGARFTAKPP